MSWYPFAFYKKFLQFTNDDTDEIKILDRETAKISALSSGESEKYEYLTGEGLGYKPQVAEKAKFEYSPLGKVFNKGLEDDDKKSDFWKD